MSCSTGKITYSEAGVTQFTYKIQVTQVMESSAAGKVKLSLKTTNRTEPEAGNGVTWNSLPYRPFRISTKSGNYFGSGIIATSKGVKYNAEAEVEIDQSYLEQTLYFQWGGLGDGSIDSATLQDDIKNSYSLTLTAGTGVSSLTAADDEGNALSTGSIVYEADTISWAAVYETGYTGDASGAFVVSASATALTVEGVLKIYKLIITVGEHAHVTVTRESDSEVLPSGCDITYGDVLDVGITADSGYELVTQSIRVGGETEESPVTVTGDVIIIAACQAMSTAHIAGETYLIKIFDGSWGDYRAMIANTAGTFENYS